MTSERTVDHSHPAALPEASEPRVELSVERFSQLLEQLYEAALNPDGWPDCLETVRALLRGNYASLIVRPGGGADRGLIVSADRKSTRLNSSHNSGSRMPSSA
jgi:hypothetical protein